MQLMFLLIGKVLLDESLLSVTAALQCVNVTPVGIFSLALDLHDLHSEDEHISSLVLRRSTFLTRNYYENNSLRIIFRNFRGILSSRNVQERKTFSEKLRVRFVIFRK